MVNTILAKRVNHIVAKGGNPACPKGSKSRGFSTKNDFLMNIETAKQINLADYLHSLGYSPVKQQGINLWYKSPLREETEASFKVNTERNLWYDFDAPI